LDFNLHRDEDGVQRSHPVLVHDMPKVGIVGYRLPVTTAVADLIADQQAWVRARHPQTPAHQLPLFPAPAHNPSGLRPITTGQVWVALRRWVAQLPDLTVSAAGEDGRIDTAATSSGSLPGSSNSSSNGSTFARDRVYLYALRHTWAQDHADAGTPLEVLQT
jgi:hypothetical protein